MQIYYYTRTGRSESIAKELARTYNIDYNQIADNISHKGAIDFMKCGAAASKKESTKGEYQDPDAIKKIVLIFPVWAGGYPPVIRDFIDTYNERGIIAITTSLGTGLKEKKGLTEVHNLIGKKINISNEIHQIFS